MFKFRLLISQIRSSRRQSVVFVLCVALSVVTLVTLGSFTRSVHSSLLRDARTLHAADLVITSHAPLSPALIRAVSGANQRNEIESARVYEFYSIVRALNGDTSLLSNLKVVEPGYPFYGAVELVSGRPFRDVLTTGSVVVEQQLLDRLQLRVGDGIRIGSCALIIRDVLVAEPDRPVNLFSLGPRVFIAAADLDALKLVGTGSRVHYSILAKVRDQTSIDRLAAELARSALPDRERVETYRTAGSGIKRFFDNLLFFLNLIGIFTLLLAGIGIQSTLTALLREQVRTIAIMKAVGAGSGFILRHFATLTFTLGIAGTLCGLAASFLLQLILPGLFRGLLPASVQLVISGSAVAEGLILGLVVVVLFTFLPLYRIKELKPRAIFARDDWSVLRNKPTWLTVAATLLFLLVMVLWRIRELKTGLYFVLGVTLLIVVTLFCSAGIMYLLKKIHPRNLILRQAVRGLFRPGNATRSTIVTLTTSLAVIFCITLVEKNLDSAFIQSFPPKAPNLFFIDIQPAQKSAFIEKLGIATTLYPIVRGTVNSVNGVAVNQEQERRKREDNLGREFNLTYREQLLEDERIVSGRTLFRPDWPGLQVSVLDTVLKMRAMKIGDTITFRIQGIPMEARISSIRTSNKGTLRPFFYFVFPSQVLSDAPQTLFAAIRVEKERIAPLQNRVVTAFPNVTVINMAETAQIFAGIMGKLATIIRFFTFFSVVAGVLIIVSSIFATRYTRIREAVYVTVLGARRSFVLSTCTVENICLGMASAMSALLLAQVGSWAICHFALDQPYTLFAGLSLMMVLAVTILIVAVGLGLSFSILRVKPAVFLREQADE
ncbi:MAG TPA: FtsX-like permease family protein [Desulfuromonadales bacterium]|nr:FtsX-like permease family protein [Desulfuromonadales bacterium]